MHHFALDHLAELDDGCPRCAEFMQRLELERLPLWLLDVGDLPASGTADH